MEQSRRGCVSRQRQCVPAVVGYGHGVRSRGFWLVLGAGAGGDSCGALCFWGKDLVCAVHCCAVGGGWVHTRAEQQETGQQEQGSACGGSEIRG